MNRDETLNRFLLGVEKKAFHMARFATADDDEALDIVQDSMMTLVRKYADRSEDEWRPLFYRILQNRITDWHRRGSRWRRLFQSTFVDADTDLVDQTAASPAMEPLHRHQLDDASDQLQQAVSMLSPKQQQAFLLRALEGLDVAQTAKVMGCSQGSVKTHHFRAVQALRKALEQHWE